MARFVIRILTIVVFILSGVFVFLKSPLVFASSIDGTIDINYKYAWSENVGWINFGLSDGNVHITDSGLTGYAWSQNYGWINLNPSISGVKNDREGNLSGYAWGENLGWINFEGVTIRSNSEFSGYAVIVRDNSKISFNCANTDSCALSDFKVKTDWRLRSARDGGGLPPGASSLPTPPNEGFSVLINQGAEYASSQMVTLALVGGLDTVRMAVSNFSDFRDASQELYQTTKIWTLTEGEGLKTVYVKFYTQYGQSSSVVSDGIIYKLKLPEEIIPSVPEEVISSPEKVIPPIAETPKPILSKIIKKIPEFLAKIPEIIKLAPPEIKLPEIPVEELVLKKAPLAMRSEWNLLPTKAIERFVLSPLPKEIKKLAEKFPEFGETLKKVGITKITDIEKLKTAKLTLPGLTERTSLLTVKIEPGKFALSQGVPVAKLSTAAKQKIPTEIVFAKTGGELIDFNIALSINEKGEFQQKISTISGKPLQLVVKPDKPVKSVKGYVVFKSRELKPKIYNLKSEVEKLQASSASPSEAEQASSKFQSLTASLIFALPSLAQPAESSRYIAIEGIDVLDDKPQSLGERPQSSDSESQETRLILLEFEYTDPDGDGIYTAEISAPAVEGEYEIITVMNFEDLDLETKEIRLITVVDPEGYIYEKDGDKETRIPGAIVSIFWLNPETKQYELWTAKEYQQENPQTTDVRGVYSFLVPEGYYYLKVETPGYLIYDGKPFQVKEGSGVHINIELKTKYWWLKIVDWKIILLIVVILLLLYNFYRDRIREKLIRPVK